MTKDEIISGLTKALKFYADAANWKGNQFLPPVDVSGEAARQALILYNGIAPRNKKKTIIHVNQINIRKNIKGSNLPVITVKTYDSNRYCDEVSICGQSKVVYSPKKPLSCGARVYIETYAGVELVGERPMTESVCQKNDD